MMEKNKNKNERKQSITIEKKNRRVKQTRNYRIRKKQDTEQQRKELCSPLYTLKLTMHKNPWEKQLLHFWLTKSLTANKEEKKNIVQMK